MNINGLGKWGGLFAGCFLPLSGCMLGPRPKIPELPKGAGYLPKVDKNIAKGQALAPGAEIGGKWWEAYGCPKLNRIVEEALANNPDLKAQQRALREAWEQRKIEGAALYPSVSANFSPSRYKTSRYYSNVPNQPWWHYTLLTAQLNVSYVPDLWGGNRAAVKVASAQAEISRDELEATTLTMIADLVNAAIMDAGLRAEIAAVKTLIQRQKEILNIEESGNRLGELSRAVPLIQQDLLAQNEADLPALEKQLAQNRTQIAVLTGLPPSAEVPQFSLDEFHLPEKLPLSYPANLLSQRPDVRAARAQIEGAAAQVGIAIANRLPNIQLSAVPGQAVGSMGKFFKPGMGNWDVLASVTETLFQGGELLHAQRAAKQMMLSATESYKAAVLSAMKDVGDSLTAITGDSRALEKDWKGLEATRKLWRIAQESRHYGDISSLEADLAALTVAADERSVAQDQTVRLSDTTALFQSLGGGWWNRNDLGVSPDRAKFLSTSLVPW